MKDYAEKKLSKVINEKFKNTKKFLINGKKKIGIKKLKMMTKIQKINMLRIIWLILIFRIPGKID